MFPFPKLRVRCVGTLRSFCAVALVVPLEHNSLWHKVTASKYGSHPFKWLASGAKVIASKYGSHPFWWLVSGVKGTYQNLWKNISKELLSFTPLVLCVVGEGKETYFGEVNGWGIDLSAPCFLVFINLNNSIKKLLFLGLQISKTLLF